MYQAGGVLDLFRVNRTIRASDLRGVLFLLCFFLFWVSVSPFQNSDTATAGVQDDANVLNQICLLAAAGLSALVMLQSDLRLLGRLISLPFVVTLAALTVASLASPDPANSLKHIVFTILVITVAAGVLFLPVSQAQFRSLLSAGAVIVLAICYLGILLYPAAAIHHGGDAIGTVTHDGGWRGLFRHKNQAGAAMALLVFVGLFVARDGHRVVGWGIAASAGVFLLQTGSKTPAALVLLVIGLAYCLRLLSDSVLRLALVTLLLTFLGLLTVGSASIEAVGAWARETLPDPTFTQRTDIWRFAVERVLERPWLGHGFREFWGTPKLVYAGYQIETWAYMATDGHNTYLDIALLAGIPALIVSLSWLVVQPIFDMKKIELAGNDNALTTLFVQIWLYCLVAGFFESTFFSGGGPVWFTFVVALLGLRMNAGAAIVRA